MLLLICTLTGQNFTSHATLDEEFCGGSVLVVMDRKAGAINRVHSSSFFTGIDVEYVRDLTAITGNPRELGINEETLGKYSYLDYAQIRERMC